MKKRFVGVALIISLLMIAMVGCGSSNDGGASGDDKSAKTTDISKYIEIMDKLEPSNTVEEINKIIGKEGELEDEKYNSYYWELEDGVGIKASYYSGKTATIKLECSNDLLSNSKVDLSKTKDLKEEMSEKTLYYDDFKDALGKVDGVVTEKGNSRKVYLWVDEKGGYLSATFDEDNKCSFMSGVTK